MSWWRHPLFPCPAIGWLAGMLLWIGLMLAFGRATARDGPEVREITVSSRVQYAPVAAIPWALMWTLVGALNLQFRGYWVPVVSGVGMIIGGVYAAAVNSYDGWLTVFMWLDCLGGTLSGLVIGVVTRASWGWLVAGRTPSGRIGMPSINGTA
jgi:hypothetical protein